MSESADTLTVTTAQAQHLSDLLQAAQKAVEAANYTASVLALGTPFEGRTLATVSPHDGVLTFHPVPE